MSQFELVSDPIAFIRHAKAVHSRLNLSRLCHAPDCINTQPKHAQSLIYQSLGAHRHAGISGGLASGTGRSRTRWRSKTLPARPAAGLRIARQPRPAAPGAASAAHAHQAPRIALEVSACEPQRSPKNTRPAPCDYTRKRKWARHRPCSLAASPLPACHDLTAHGLAQPGASSPASSTQPGAGVRTSSAGNRVLALANARHPAGKMADVARGGVRLSKISSPLHGQHMQLDPAGGHTCTAEFSSWPVAECRGALCSSAGARQSNTPIHLAGTSARRALQNAAVTEIAAQRARQVVQIEHERPRHANPKV
jgi:hypothetical protein